MSDVWKATEPSSNAEAVLGMLTASGTLAEIDATFDRVEHGQFQLEDPADAHDLIRCAREHFELGGG